MDRVSALQIGGSQLEALGSAGKVSSSIMS